VFLCNCTCPSTEQSHVGQCYGTRRTLLHGGCGLSPTSAHKTTLLHLATVHNTKCTLLHERWRLEPNKRTQGNFAAYGFCTKCLPQSIERSVRNGTVRAQGNFAAHGYCTKWVKSCTLPRSIERSVYCTRTMRSTPHQSALTKRHLNPAKSQTFLQPVMLPIAMHMAIRSPPGF